MLRFVSESETVELLLPNVSGPFHFFKSSIKIRRTTVFEMPNVSAFNREVTFRSSLTILSTAEMLSSARLVVGRTLLSSSFTDPLPSRNRLCHSKIVVCFLLGNYPASGCYMPTFRNTLSVPSS